MKILLTLEKYPLIIALGYDKVENKVIKQNKVIEENYIMIFNISVY